MVWANVLENGGIRKMARRRQGGSLNSEGNRGHQRTSRRESTSRALRLLLSKEPWDPFPVYIWLPSSVTVCCSSNLTLIPRRCKSLVLTDRTIMHFKNLHIHSDTHMETKVKNTQQESIGGLCDYLGLRGQFWPVVCKLCFYLISWT